MTSSASTESMSRVRESVPEAVEPLAGPASELEPLHAWHVPEPCAVRSEPSSPSGIAYGVPWHELSSPQGTSYALQPPSSAWQR
jgi:hypothetical protein